MSAPKEFTAPGMALRTAAILFVFVIVFTGLLSAAEQWTRPAIQASARAEKMKLIDALLPSQDYDNQLLSDTATLPPEPELGTRDATTVYRARKDGQPVAAIFEAVAPDGYAGRINLILALRANGELAGVRVTQYKETPGLGDYIDPKKDKNKDKPWISQFGGLSLANTPDKDWKVKKDGGRIAYRTGATVSPRAVTKAVFKAVRWATANRDLLFATTTGEAK